MLTTLSGNWVLIWEVRFGEVTRGHSKSSLDYLLPLGWELVPRSFLHLPGHLRYCASCRETAAADIIMHGSLGVSFTQCAVGYKEASLERACYGKDGVGGVMRAYEANWAAQTSERGGSATVSTGEPWYNTGGLRSLEVRSRVISQLQKRHAVAKRHGLPLPLSKASGG